MSTQAYRGVALVSGAIMVENFFDGTLLNQLLKSCPLGFVAGLFRNGGGMIETIFCFKWVRLVVSMLPTSGKIGFFLRGGMLLVIAAEWIMFSWLQSHMAAQQAENINWLYYLYILAIVFGVVTILADPKVTITPIRQKFIDERAKDYKQKLSVDLKYCGFCEQVQTFRSVHSQIEGRCIAKLEYYSFALNCTIGARNLLPMTFFNLMMFLVHYTWLAVSSDILASTVTETLEPWQFLVGGVFVIYGVLFTLKEVVSNVVSWITGTTNHERKSGMSPPYFKSRGGTYNPFYKSVLINIQEVWIAFTSSTKPERIMTSATLPETLDEEDDEKQKSQPASDLDIIMAKYLNPFATKVACDWTQMDLLTIFEVDCEMREVMKVGMKRMMAKMRGSSAKHDSDEGSDDDVFIMDTRPPASHFANSTAEHGHGHSGCGSCKNHSKKPAQAPVQTAKPEVSVAPPKQDLPTDISQSQDL